MNKKWISGMLAGTMLFGMAAVTSLPVQAAVPVQENIIFDDLIPGQTLFDADLSTMDNITVKYSEQVNVYDSTRAFKNSDTEETLDRNTYLTYVHEEQPMTGVVLRAAFRKTKVTVNYPAGTYKDDFRIETSADGETYANLDFDGAFVFYGGSLWGNNQWGEGILTIDTLPENTHYLRIYFPQTADLGEHKDISNRNSFSQLCSVAITIEKPPVETLNARIAEAEDIYNAVCTGKVPSLYSYSKAKALDEALKAAKAVETEYAAVCAALDTLETALQAFIDSVQGIPATYVDECNSETLDTTFTYLGVGQKVPKDFANLIDSQGRVGESTYSLSGNAVGSYFVYEIEDDSKTISNLVLETTHHIDAAGTLMGDMIVKAAPAEALTGEESVNPEEPDGAKKPVFDQTKFTTLPYTTEQLENYHTKWERHHMTIPVVPAGTKYIWIEFPDLGNKKAHVMVSAVKWTVLDADSQFAAGDFKLKQTYAGDDKAAFTVTYTGEAANKPVWLTVAEYTDGVLTDVSMAKADCAKGVPQTLETEAITSKEGSETRILLWDGAALSPLIGTIKGF